MKYEDLDVRSEMGLGSYLVVISAGEKDCEYARRIVHEAAIMAALPMHESIVDGRHDYCYDATGKTSIYKAYSRKTLEYEDMKKITKAMCDMIRMLSDFLIDRSSLLLDPLLIFTNANGDIFFTIYPDGIEDAQSGICMLAKFFMKRINHEDEGARVAAYKFFELTDEESFDFDEVEKIFCDESVNNQANSDMLLDIDRQAFESGSENADTYNLDNLMKEDGLDDDFFTADIESDVFGEDDFNEEDYEIDDEEGDDNYKKELDLSENSKEMIMKIAIFAIPSVVFLIICIFMFSDRMADLSLGLRLVATAAFGVAMALVAVICHNKIKQKE